MACIRKKIVKIKKEHQCHYCCQSFKKGTFMETQINTDDSEHSIYTLYQCLECNEFLKSIDNDMIKEFTDIDGCFPEGCVRETLSDYGCELNEKSKFIEKWNIERKYHRGD